MRLVILDAGLTSRRGPQPQVNRLMVEEARARGIDCVIYANQGVDADVRAALPAHPFFRHGPDHSFSHDPLSGLIESYVWGNQVYLEDLKQLDVNRLEPDDILLFHPVNHTQLQAIGAWAQGVPAARLPRIVVGVWFEPHHGAATTTQDVPYALYRLAFKSFAQPSLARVRFSCLSKAQADEYTLIAGRPCLPTPTPFTSADVPLLERASGAAPACLGFLGYARKSKGFELIPGILDTLLGTHPHIRAAIQINGEAAELAELEATIIALEKLAAANPQIRLLRGELEHADYIAALQACDVIVLPYRSKFYPMSPSRIFMDAMNLGKPVILPINTWMSRKVGAWSVGTVFEGFSSAAVALAVRPVLDDLPAFRARALENAIRWRKTEGVGPFFDFLLQDGPETLPADHPVGR
jgi:glycosyltransferase involved in cell wall biosynthesis